MQGWLMKLVSLSRTRIDLAKSCATLAIVGVAAFADESPPLQRITLSSSTNATTPTELWSPAVRPTASSQFSPDRLKELMRPNLKFGYEWQSAGDGIDLSSIETGISIPTYPFLGPPPPMINLGFDYTNIDAPSEFKLPVDLYETEFGVAWMRRLNDKWMARLMAGALFATDGNNVSSDAWQFRGGLFAIYRRKPELTWTFGAIALGRNDLPVLPAVGAIYQPNPAIRFDLIMPQPRIAILLADNGPRQQWGYIGAGLRGTTCGIERPGPADDQLTYGDIRLTLGWESTPTPEPGIPFTRGRKMGAEIGYVFSRDFEFDIDDSKIRLSDTWMLRGTLSF